jgi:hypothetical protein
MDYSENAIINELKRVASVTEKPLTIRKFDSNSIYCSATIRNRFGSWKNALKKAKLDDSYLHINNFKFNKEYIIKEMYIIAKKLNTKSFTRNEFLKNSNVGYGIIRHYFGSYKNLMNEVGFEIPKKSRFYTEDERYENLLNVWTFYGRQPTSKEMNKAPSKVGSKTYINHWGTWKKALLAFINMINKKNESIPTTKIIVKNTIVNKKVSNEDKRDIPIGLRFRIFKRDNYKCVMCGRSPSSTFGLELHVDHIIPFSKEGKTIEKNLRTLCNQCNIGKKDNFD